jgi:hypothetical protein
VSKLDSMLKEAEANLNNAYSVYKTSRSDLAHEFDELKLQSCIFQYEACAVVSAYLSSQPTGFARSVSLKGLLHQLFEYESLRGRLLKRLRDLAEARGLTLNEQDLRNERKRWREHFGKLAGWATIRNTATGHYDQDTGAQVAALETIDSREVMEVCIAVLSSNIEFLKLVAEVGRQHGT